MLFRSRHGQRSCNDRARYCRCHVDEVNLWIVSDNVLKGAAAKVCGRVGC